MCYHINNKEMRSVENVMLIMCSCVTDRKISLHVAIPTRSDITDNGFLPYRGGLIFLHTETKP